MARRYVRDNRGRFASKGAGATARGGRLKTAGGKKRATQTMKASGAKPAGAIKGKVKRDPAAASRVGQSGAAKPAAKRRRTISPEKTARVAQRVNAVTAGAAAKSGVKRMNATEVGVRAKAFLTRKAGGMSGMVGKNFAEQQAVVRSGLTNRPRYSTQKPNRNKPLRYNALGQDKARTAARIASQTPATPKPAASKPAASRPASRMIGRRELIGRNTATGKAPTSAKARRIASTMRKPAPKPASNTGRRQPLRGGAAFARNPKGFQGLPVIARTKRESGAVQRFRRESILERTRQMGTRKNPRIRKQQTGMSQLSLMGKAVPLVRFRPVKR
jgi:hypothetical protein